MPNAERFDYTAGSAAVGEASLLPLLPITLEYQQRSAAASGLLDTGATVNVLPYRVGVELGAVWEAQTIPVQLSGNLADYEARALMVSPTFGFTSPPSLTETAVCHTRKASDEPA